MGIVSIGEVVGSVTAGASEPERTREDRATKANALSVLPSPETLERALRVQAWRRTRLHAD